MKSGVCSRNGMSAYKHDILYKSDTTFWYEENVEYFYEKPRQSRL